MKSVARTQIRIPVELYDTIKGIAENRYASMNSIVVEALLEYVTHKKALSVLAENRAFNQTQPVKEGI